MSSLYAVCVNSFYLVLYLFLTVTDLFRYLLLVFSDSVLAVFEGNSSIPFSQHLLYKSCNGSASVYTCNKFITFVSAITLNAKLKSDIIARVVCT